MIMNDCNWQARAESVKIRRSMRTEKIYVRFGTRESSDSSKKMQETEDRYGAKDLFCCKPERGDLPHSQR
ncbi:hypothetical protein D4R75_10635 [bacterium]|nr:MAG: hypothetical protein D4R75_10635 [bacterium]